MKRAELPHPVNCSANPPKSVDYFYASAPEPVRPICLALRRLVQCAAPKLRESIKWRMACFEGRKLVCCIGAFKRHASLTFFQGARLADPDGLLACGQANAASRSIKLFSAREIPVTPLRGLLKAAVALDGSDAAKPLPRLRRAPLPVPQALATALAEAPTANARFDLLTPGCRREYIEWLATAKHPETIARRLKAIMTMLEKGR